MKTKYKNLRHDKLSLKIMFNKIGFVEIEKSAELEASWQKMKYGDRRQISKYQGG